MIALVDVFLGLRTLTIVSWHLDRFFPHKATGGDCPDIRGMASQVLLQGGERAALAIVTTTIEDAED